MIIIGAAAARRAMRRHQGMPSRGGPHLPLWRLLLGELVWALRQLRREPPVLGALLLGVVATLAVLDATAPGPVLHWPARVLVSLVAGLVLARGTWAWISRGRRRERRPDEDAPGAAATEVVALAATGVLLGWLLVWLVTLVR